MEANLIDFDIYLCLVSVDLPHHLDIQMACVVQIKNLGTVLQLYIDLCILMFYIKNYI